MNCAFDCITRHVHVYKGEQHNSIEIQWYTWLSMKSSGSWSEVGGRERGGGTRCFAEQLWWRAQVGVYIQVRGGRAHRSNLNIWFHLNHHHFQIDHLHCSCRQIPFLSLSPSIHHLLPALFISVCKHGFI